MVGTFKGDMRTVFVPLPQGDLRTVRLRRLVGMRMGPLPFLASSLSIAPFLKSAHTFSSACALRLVKVMRMRSGLDSASSSLPFCGYAAAAAAMEGFGGARPFTHGLRDIGHSLTIVAPWTFKVLV